MGIANILQTEASAQPVRPEQEHITQREGALNAVCMLIPHACPYMVIKCTFSCCFALLG